MDDICAKRGGENVYVSGSKVNFRVYGRKKINIYSHTKDRVLGMHRTRIGHKPAYPRGQDMQEEIAVWI